MEGIILIWIIWQAVKMAGGELPFTLRGITPPSHEYRMEKLRRSRTGSGRSTPSSRPGQYFAGIMDEALDRGRVKRAAKTKVKTAKIQTKAEHDAGQVAVNTKAKLERKAAAKADRLARRAGRAGPDSQPGQRSGQGFPESQDGGQDTRPEGTPIAVPANLDKFDVPSAAGEPAEPTAVKEPARYLNAVPTGSSQPESPSTAEVFSLPQAITYCQQLVHSLQVTLAMIEVMAENLEHQHKVDGPVLTHLGEVWSILEQAIVDIRSTQKELESRLSVKDAREAVDGDAGTQGYIEEAG
jgi:hypothetical protein